ncbi:MAG: isoprenylcysteine carboxylmethyltransferase family protein [Hyphomicrobiaceae bacterium]
MTVFPGKRDGLQEDRPSAIPWPPALFAASVLMALALDWWLLRLPFPFAETGPVHYAGMLLLLGAIVLAVWAMLEFRRHATSIRPDRGSTALMATGPFAFSRNPIYLAEAIGLAGAGISFNRLWLVVAAPIFLYAVTRFAIEREEAYLERRFGAAYADYKARVRRWL